MKKILFSAALVASMMTLASCGAYKYTNHTATTKNVATAVSSTNVADLEVGKRVSFTYTTTADDRRGGTDNCKKAAVAALLKANGNADILLQPEYKYDTDLNTIEVSGRPASYKNFRGAN